MDRASALSGAYAKLDRADEHFKALEAELQTFIQRNRDLARGKLQEFDGETFYVMYASEVRGVPPRIGLVLGDAIHNLRAALDHTVWQLVGFHDGKPNPGNQFPIFSYFPTKQRDIDRWDRNVRGIMGADLALIEHVQPRRRSDPSAHPLAVLADLSNTDKHRLILASALTIDLAPDAMPEFDPRDLDIEGPMQLTYSKRLEADTEIFRVAVRAWGKDPHMDVHGSFPVGVAFGEAEYEARGVNLMRKYVRDLVKAFEDPEAISANLRRWVEAGSPTL